MAPERKIFISKGYKLSMQIQRRKGKNNFLTNSLIIIRFAWLYYWKNCPGKTIAKSTKTTVKYGYLLYRKLPLFENSDIGKKNYQIESDSETRDKKKISSAKRNSSFSFNLQTYLQKEWLCWWKFIIPHCMHILHFSQYWYFAESNTLQS